MSCLAVVGAAIDAGRERANKHHTLLIGRASRGGSAGRRGKWAGETALGGFDSPNARTLCKTTRPRLARMHAPPPKPVRPWFPPSLRTASSQHLSAFCSRCTACREAQKQRKYSISRSAVFKSAHFVHCRRPPGIRFPDRHFAAVSIRTSATCAMDRAHTRGNPAK